MTIPGSAGRSGGEPSRQDVDLLGAEVPGPVHQGHVRHANSWSVLSAVRMAGVTSRSRVSRDTGLTAMTVHRLMTDLRRHRLVVSAGSSTRGKVGRPASLFCFNASIGYVAGIDIGNETTRFVLANLDGRPLAQAERPTADIESDVARHLVTTIGELHETTGIARDKLVGIGVGVPAVVDAEGLIVRASQHHVWEGLPLGSHLRKAFGSDVVVRQDDQLAALAELRHGACTGLRTGVVLNVGKGIGVGIIVDGAVHSGAHAAAGRVAWLPVSVDTTDPGEATLLGRRLTGDGLVAAYRERGGEAEVGRAAGVFAADAGGDLVAGLVIDEFAARLGWLIAALVAVLDPEVVVIGGGISRSFDRLRLVVERRLAEIVPIPPRVVASTLVPDAVAIGAVDAARELADGWLRDRIGL
jgi:predicted NBD/HSP70 family sugar kinase